MKFTPKRQKLFLSLVKVGVSATSAAEKCKISVRNCYRLRDRNAKFRRLWEESLDFAVEAAEQELRRRAVDGVERPVFYKGEKIATEKEWSDQLLLAYLRANRPEKYRERSEVRHDGEVRQTAVVVIADRGLPADVRPDEIEPARSEIEASR